MVIYFLLVLVQSGFTQPFLYRLADYKIDFTGEPGSWVISPSFKFLPKEDNGQFSVSYEAIKNGVFSASYVLSNPVNQQLLLAAAYGYPFEKIKRLKIPGR
ncbi:MAG: hypothetical protein IPN29_11180 [Saprospiraceae bacterium]|nr:hypothetical protein [Saprospiraceae bacterium]